MSLKKVHRGTARSRLYRRVETQDGRGWTHQEDGYREGAVEVWVDLDRIVALYGPDALSNKGRRARAMNGCVEIVAVAGMSQDHRLATKEG